jgi:peptidylprolyl isomerase
MYSNLFRFLLAALLATTPLLGHGDDAGHDHADHIEELSAEASEAAPIEVSQADLIEMIGYLTAQGGGVPMLELSEADIAMLADGLNMGLSGEFDVMAIAQTELQAAFAEAQARAEAVESGAEEFPAFSEGSLKKIGAVMVMQSGLEQLGFGAEDADQITAGFIAGASAKEMDPSFEAKLPAFQAFIQERIQAAQADMMRVQEAALQEAMAEFESYAAEWKEKENFNIVLQTTQGDVTIELMPSVAPLAVANFVGHIENGYYDGLTFHRIIKDFMIQGGDPVGNGTGGESIWGKNFPDEFSPDVRFDTEGLLAMANSGPMTNGSQFFITTSTPEWLNDKHTIFGKVVEGYENIEKLEGVETGAQDVPVEAQAIIKAYVVE